ncbi:HIT domain-containing protein, partial [Acinetobacter baumannii]
MFTLHTRLAADTIHLGDFPLSQCLLMNDSQDPWLILVPRRPDLREVHELSEADQQQLLRESSWVSARLAA